MMISLPLHLVCNPLPSFMHTIKYSNIIDANKTVWEGLGMVYAAVILMHGDTALSCRKKKLVNQFSCSKNLCQPNMRILSEGDMTVNLLKDPLKTWIRNAQYACKFSVNLSSSAVVVFISVGHASSLSKDREKAVPTARWRVLL